VRTRRWHGCCRRVVSCRAVVYNLYFLFSICCFFGTAFLYLYRLRHYLLLISGSAAMYCQSPATWSSTERFSLCLFCPRPRTPSLTLFLSFSPLFVLPLQALSSLSTVLALFLQNMTQFRVTSSLRSGQGSFTGYWKAESVVWLLDTSLVVRNCRADSK
jgi:hypothetical protein